MSKIDSCWTSVNELQDRRLGIMFSIIIPVFNVEKYLEECVISVINQDWQDCEVILVDDGSEDKSGIICDRLCYKYDMVHAYHKENGGLSSARNYGISKAKGKYIYFLDSDDYLLQGALKDFSTIIEKYEYPDIICENGMYNKINGELRLRKYYTGGDSFGKKSGECALLEFMSGPSIHTACGKCFLREMWIDKKWTFVEGITSEDLDLIYKVIFEAESVVMTENTYYVYRLDREGSIMYSSSSRKIRDYFGIFDRWEDYLETNVKNEAIKTGMNRLLGNVYVQYVLSNIKYIDCDKELIEEIRRYIRYLDYSDSHRVSFFVRILGFYNTIKYINVLLRIDEHIRWRVGHIVQKKVT